MDHKKKFNELYNYIVASRETGKMKMLGWVMKAMMEQTIANHPQMAEEYINVLESVRWDNYLTEQEAEKIVTAMSPAPMWKKQQWELAMNQMGWDMEHYPCYNKCALYVTMCMVDSDDGDTVAELISKEGSVKQDADYLIAIHKLALNKLQDEDGVFNIRRYFKDILWPEKNDAR